MTWLDSRVRLRCSIFLFLMVALPTAVLAQKASSQIAWKLVWSDEFDGPRNTPPDPAKWTYDLGDKGWGNNELEVYTNRLKNAYQDGQGHLVIQVVRSRSGVYSSARLKTWQRFSVKYGRIEGRIKMAFGQGIWPAFWMLGANIHDPGVGWPRCGEIDIMENIGREPGTVHGTVHGPGYSGSHGIGKPYSLPAGEKFASQFHLFSIDWEPDFIRFMVDSHVFHVVTPATLPRGTRWVYDHPFFLLLNVAVGGDWPGNPHTTTAFPQKMLVDYVRVYMGRNPPLQPVGVADKAAGGKIRNGNNNEDQEPEKSADHDHPHQSLTMTQMHKEQHNECGLTHRNSKRDDGIKVAQVDVGNARSQRRETKENCPDGKI